jgi:hypothetical protein
MILSPCVIYRLTPIDPQRPEWQFSRWGGVVFVRARSASQAGRLATLEIEGWSSLPVTPFIPRWLSGHFSFLEVDEDSVFSCEGPEGVLSPDIAKLPPIPVTVCVRNDIGEVAKDIRLAS